MASAASDTVEGTTIPPELDYQGFYIINAFAFVSTLIFVVARLYVRRHMAKAIGPDGKSVAAILSRSNLCGVVLARPHLPQSQSCKADLGRLPPSCWLGK